ncbi:hypothetical protein BKA62DRAFT_773955 [Auriculariales sp. MPI-PUGE-AT-0066]|nr:hypothetical protein BKA62DRAFT_773955 [Auriculariales sp. MPI-PUGE-AT-0066]
MSPNAPVPIILDIRQPIEWSTTTALLKPHVTSAIRDVRLASIGNSGIPHVLAAAAASRNIRTLTLGVWAFDRARFLFSMDQLNANWGEDVATELEWPLLDDFSFDDQLYRGPPAIADLVPYLGKVKYLEIGARMWAALQVLESVSVSQIHTIVVGGLHDHRGGRSGVSSSGAIKAFEARIVSSVRVAAPAMRRLKTVARTRGLGINVAQTEVLTVLAAIPSLRTLRLGYPSHRRRAIDALAAILSATRRTLRTLQFTQARPACDFVEIIAVLQVVVKNGGLCGLRKLWVPKNLVNQSIFISFKAFCVERRIVLLTV